MPGTTPAVLSVTRRFEMPNAQVVHHDRRRTNGIVEIQQRLAHPHHHHVGNPAFIAHRAQRRR